MCWANEDSHREWNGDALTRHRTNTHRIIIPKHLYNNNQLTCLLFCYVIFSRSSYVYPWQIKRMNGKNIRNSSYQLENRLQSYKRNYINKKSLTHYRYWFDLIWFVLCFAFFSLVLRGFGKASDITWVSNYTFTVKLKTDADLFFARWKQKEKNNNQISEFVWFANTL